MTSYYEQGSNYDYILRVLNNTVPRIKQLVEDIVLKRFRSNFNEAEYWFNYELSQSDDEMELLNVNNETSEETYALLTDIIEDYNIRNALPNLSVKIPYSLDDFVIALIVESLYENGKTIVTNRDRIHSVEDIADRILYLIPLDDWKEIYPIATQIEKTCEKLLKTETTEIDNTYSDLYSNEVLVNLYYRQ